MKNLNIQTQEIVEIPFTIPLKVYVHVKNNKLFFPCKLLEGEPAENLPVIECNKGKLIFLKFKPLKEPPDDLVALDINDFHSVLQTPPLATEYQFADMCQAMIFVSAFEYLSRSLCDLFYQELSNGITVRKKGTAVGNFKAKQFS